MRRDQHPLRTIATRPDGKAQSSCGFKRPVVVFSAVLIGHLATAAHAQPRLLIDGNPFDEIVLKEENQVFRIEPLELAPRRPIEKIDPQRVFVVQLIDRPGKKYRIRGEAIAQIRLFEQLVLNEASERLDREDFYSAYRCYRYLSGKQPDFPGLKEAWAQALLKEARYWYGRKEPDRTWRILLALGDRHPPSDAWKAFMAEVAES